MVTETQTVAERKALAAQLEAIPTPVPQSFWDKTKAFFHYSTTIAEARFTAFTGLVIAGVGMMDWSPLLGVDINTGFNKAQVLWLGGITFVKGLMTEIARRRSLP